MRRTATYVLIAIALAIIGLITPVLLNFSSLYARIYEDRRFPALSRYALEPTPDIALVGSSMTARIREGYFKTRLRNISTSGGSPLTGLAILASYPSLPRVAFVETNMMSRTAETELVEQFGQNGAAAFQWFRPHRAVISFVYYWLKYRSDDVDSLINSAPANYDISSSLHQAETEYARPVADEAIAENTQSMKRLVSILQSRGCKVYFYELPYPENLGNSHFAVTARTQMHSAFPDPKQWPQFVYPLQELRWVDAAHMDERSAAIAAQEMDTVLDNISARSE
jgi:hypothetical protein